MRTWRDEDTGDAGESADHHGLEEDPAPAPLVHHVPAQEVGRHLHGRAAVQKIVWPGIFIRFSVPNLKVAYSRIM